MTNGSRILDPLALDVPRPLVLLRLGYRRPGQVPERTSRMLDAVIARGRGLLTPRAAYVRVAVATPEPDIAAIGDTLRARSRSLVERLNGCREAVVFAATIGPALETWVGELASAGEEARSLLADAYASSAAIALGAAIESVVGRLFGEEGLDPTRRHAPGYGDWALTDQAPLLALLDTERIGLTLTEEHLMIPAKSISGLIGGRGKRGSEETKQRAGPRPAPTRMTFGGGGEI